MASGWDVNVYRTDLEEELFVGFFHDQAEADKWIKKQAGGAFETRPRAPKVQQSEH